MKLILHIGTEKTGTTLLQNWLYANQKSLSDQGVFLSDELGKPNNRKLVSYFQQRLDDYTRRKGVSSKAEKATFFDGFIEQFMKELHNGARDHHTMVITSEHFHSRLCSPSEIRALKQFLNAHFSDIRILCYFREQSQMRVSLYSTGLKAATRETLSEFNATADENTYYYNFYQIATQWADVFGQENCDFRIYDRKHFNAGDLRRDFLSALPVVVDSQKLSFDERVASNESLSLLEGRMFRVINQIIPYWREGQGINPENAFFKRVVRRCTRLNFGRIGDPQKSEFAARFKASNRRLFDRFFGGKDMFPVRDTSCGEREPQQVSIHDLADVIEDVAKVFCESFSGRVLLDKDANILRNIALKYETGAPLTQADALALMRLAKRARPHGGMIRQKIQDWSENN